MDFGGYLHFAVETHHVLAKTEFERLPYLESAYLQSAPSIVSRITPLRLFVHRQTPNAGCGWLELSETSHRVAQPNKALPVELRNFTFRLAFAQLKQ